MNASPHYARPPKVSRRDTNGPPSSDCNTHRAGNVQQRADVDTDWRGHWMNRTRVNAVRPAGRRVPGLILVLAAIVMVTPSVFGDPGDSPYFGDPVISAGGPPSGGNQPPNPYSFNAPTIPVRGMGGNSADLDPYFQVPGGGQGVEARIGHIVGETVGRDESLTHIDLQPYVFVEETMLLFDLRMFRLNEGPLGGNLGAGFRHYFEDRDVVLGALGYVDIDETRSKEFQQWGLSLEMLSRWLDVRANWYVPFGDREQILGTSFLQGTQRFSENFLLVDTLTLFSNAAEGVDLTVTAPVPWEMLQPYNVEMSAGMYHYQVRDTDLPKLWGYRVRADASFFDRSLQTYVELTHDRQHETKVIFGASLAYYGGFESRNRVKDRQYYRMSEWVRRNYNVVTVDTGVVNEGVPVINPLDGEPYFFAHIKNNDPGPLPRIGTVENPFDSILTAFAESPDADVFYVQGGSVFTGDEATLVVPENKILLGEPPTVVNNQGQRVPTFPHTLPTILGSRLRDIDLPIVVPEGGGVRLEESSGVAIDATNALLVGGFTIVDPESHGLLVQGQSNVMNQQFFTTANTNQLFRDITILGADGDGILFDDASANGTFVLQRVNVRADDTLGGTRLNADGAMGVAFHVSEGTASIRATDILPPNTQPPDVLLDPTFENSAVVVGSMTFDNPNEVILIENTEGGTVNLSNTTANDHAGAPVGQGGGGIRLINNLGSVIIGEAVIDNTFSAANGGPNVGAGVEVDGSSGLTTFTDNITVTNADGVGFLVQNIPDVGVVTVSGNSGDPTTIAVLSRNDIGADFFNIDGRVNFTSSTSLNIGDPNDPAVTVSDPALQFHASTGDVILNDVTIIDSLGDGILIGDLSDPTGALQNMATRDPVTLEIVDRPRFFVNGTATITNTGDPANPGTAAIRVQGLPFNDTTNPDGEPTDVSFRGPVMIEERRDRGIQIINTSGDILFADDTTVLNNNAANPSNRSSLHIDNSVSDISFDMFTSDGTIGGEPAVEVQFVPRPGSVGFNDLRIQNAVGDGADLPGGDGDLTAGAPSDVTGLLVRYVNSFSTVEGSIFVQEGIAVDIEHVYPQNEQLQWLVLDSQDRIVIIDSTTGVVVGDPTTEPDNRNNGFVVRGVLDDDGNLILDSAGNPIIPALEGLRSFAGYDVTLTDVSSINGAQSATPNGIYLEDNVGRFIVQGVAGTPETGDGMPDSGGEIVGTTVSGIFALDADQVTLQRQFYNGNNVGMFFSQMNENMDQGAFLFGNQIQGSPQEGIFAINVRNITIQGDGTPTTLEFFNNGFVNRATGIAGQNDFANTIFIVVNELPNNRFDMSEADDPSTAPYNYSIIGNDFADLFRTVAADGARIETQTGARGARLNLLFQANNFIQFDRVQNTTGGSPQGATFANWLSVQWEGEIFANVLQNSGSLTAIDAAVTAGNRRAFEIVQTSTDHTSVVFLQNNGTATAPIVFENALNTSGVGAFFQFQGQTTVSATNNFFDLGSGGTGLVFSLFDQFNTITIANNEFDFQTLQNNPPIGSGIGVDVRQVLGQSTFIINGNRIGSDTTAAFTGFRFRPTAVVNLIGQVQNTVTANDFFDPDNNPNIFGQININGNFLP